jgi:hypothetical protein
MKVKWRAHERLLVTGLVFLSVAVFAGQLFPIGNRLYNLQHFLPQAGSLLSLYLAYLWINLLIVPMSRKAVTQAPNRWLRITVSVFQVLLLAYLTGPGVNFISFYASPEYTGFKEIPLTFGSHPQPLLNTFGGFDMALILVLLYCLYAAIRELIIAYINKPGPQRTYRVLVINQSTALALIFLGLPFVLAAFQLVHPIFYTYYFALVPPVLLTFMTNYYWLFPLYEGKNLASFKFILTLLLLVLFLTLPFSLFLGDEWTPGLLYVLLTVQFFLIVPVTWLIYRNRKDRITALRGAETALVRSTADLQLLRSQINPHFLFNALNSLYATALREKSPDTATGIQRLGDMMRFMLHDNQRDLIPMGREMEYLENYIALQKLRLPESSAILIEDNLGRVTCNCRIAPMLLIPFVENAFKHGISLQEKSWIRIILECAENQISLEVRNSVHPALANDPEQGKLGIGLQNVRERLLISYEGRHELKYGIEGDEFIVNLSVQTNS